MGPARPLQHVHAAPLSAGLEGVPLVLQGLRVSPSGDVLLANPLRPVILAAGL
jgi:hypothetical protein